MTAERWQRIQEVFHLAVSCDEAARNAVLAAETTGDDDLRREVEKMLRFSSGPGPLDQPAWDGTPLDEGPSAGARLGPYELLEQAGAGGMGRVFKARDTRLDRTVAIKVLSAEFSHRFQAEARAISALNHPHVCALYDIGEQDGAAYLVMEFVEGESLAARLRSGPLSIDEVLLYGAQIAGALAAAHRLGIVHRDLKPANIMITESGAKVLDFGVARMAAVADPAGAAPQPVMGTLAYMSPSQLNGNPPDVRSDIYSLGLVLFEMASGQRPFPGLTPPLQAPAALTAWIGRCLRQDVLERPQSMDEVRFALERMRSAAPRASLRRIQAAWMAALLMTLTAGGALLWKLARPARPEAAVLTRGSAMPAPPPAPQNDSAPAAAPLRNVATTAYQPPAPPSPQPSLLTLTTYRGFVRDPSLSPDGKTVAFSWSTPGHAGYGLYVRPVWTDEPARELTDGGVDDWGSAWSPDGHAIAFRRSGRQPGIYLVPPAGGQPQLLAPIGHQNSQTLPQMSWSPDGKWIAAPDRDASGGTQICLFQSRSGEKRPITSNPGGIDHAPAFSPNGKSLAFTSCEAGPTQCDVYVIDVAAGSIPRTQRQVTHQGFYTRGIAWAPDGRSLVYAAGPGMGQPTYLWRVSVNPPGTPERIDLAGARANHPAISRAGQLLAYTDFSPGNWRLKLIENFR
ncbi:MAG TPA: protein kinase [Verrucomicrobiae bacterium]|nr:protein kinase [Verrucomicrobiae bacterium]